MARRTANYWQRRAEARLIAIERGTEPYLQRIFRINAGVVESIREDIERIIGNFAKHSQLTREEAISLLGETITEVERQRIIAMCAGIEDKATKARLMAKVNAPAYRARIDRLLAIEVSAQAKMALLAPRQIDTITSGLHKAGMEMYSRTMFDLQRGTGLGFSFAGVTDKQIESVMREPWSGDHYSSRVWRNTQIVAERIRDTVEQNMITGKSWRRSLNAVTDQALIDSNYAASRIMRTETAYVTNEIEALAYEEVGLDEYKYVATLDGRTSDVCRELDGKKFKLRDREVGKNYPPMHPHCRSTTVAVIDGFDMSELQRRARDPETGETYKVPADMKYAEWYQKHVVDTGKEWSVKAYQNRHRDLRQYEAYKDAIGKSNMPLTFRSFQQMKYQEPQRWDLLKGYKSEVTSGNISPLVGFKNFEKEHNSLIERFVGTKTSDGVEIKGIKPHFTARKIGTHEWMADDASKEIRNRLRYKAVKSEQIEDALSSGVYRDTLRKEKTGKMMLSRQYQGQECVVTVNPETGMLIQTNRKKRK